MCRIYHIHFCDEQSGMISSASYPVIAKSQKQAEVMAAQTSRRYGPGWTVERVEAGDRISMQDMIVGQRITLHAKHAEWGHPFSDVWEFKNNRKLVVATVHHWDPFGGWFDIENTTGEVWLHLYPVNPYFGDGDEVKLRWHGLDSPQAQAKTRQGKWEDIDFLCPYEIATMCVMWGVDSIWCTVEYR